jgi:hypothetical protein
VGRAAAVVATEAWDFAIGDSIDTGLGVISDVRNGAYGAAALGAAALACDVAKACKAAEKVFDGVRGAWRWIRGTRRANVPDDATTYLYRGVHGNHPEIEAARAGRAVPGNPNGTITAAEHNLGEVNLADSPFTSWTRNLDVAQQRAGDGGVILRVPTGAPPPGASWRWEWSPDVWQEGEVLLRGVREGCTVLKC